jgi:hypothetical protein
MSFEPLIISKWIYDTLGADNTLAILLAGSKAPNYQQGVYLEVAPEKDPISQQMPQLPYVVFQRVGSEGSDETALCGDRFYTVPIFRITVWDQQNGSISYQRVNNIINRVDLLLGKQTVTVSGLTFLSQRYDTDQPFEVGSDGRVDYGLSLLYRFNTAI